MRRRAYRGPTFTIIGVATRSTPGTRAKDSDRNDTCQILDSALSDGQLSMEEHRTRVAQATQAETLGDLQSLVSDLQTENAPVQLPDLKQRPRISAAGTGWGIRAAVAGVLVVLGIAIGWGLYGNTTSPLSFTSDPGAKSDGIPATVLTPPRRLQSLGGLNGLFEQMKQKFGDTQGYRLVVYPDYASLNRPDPNDDRKQASYTYRGGFGDPSLSAKDANGKLVDLSKFDVKAIVGILRGAPETLGMTPGDVTSTYLIIEPNSDVTAPEGSLEVSIYISSDFGGGHLELNADGTQKSINYPG
jgi:hypothetical protein